MAGVAENVNVRVTLTLEKKSATKVVRRQKQFSIEQLPNDYQTTIARLLSDFSTPLWELYFDRYCIPLPMDLYLPLPCLSRALIIIFI